MNQPIKIIFLLSLALNAFSVVASVQTIKIVYLTQAQNPPSALSNLDPFIQQKGLIGAELAIAENNITGQFTGQKFELSKILVPVDGNITQMFQQSVADDSFFVVTNLPVEPLKLLSKQDIGKQKLFFDASTTDDNLRQTQCQNNILHLLPSRAMRADALAQYMLKKSWKKWFLVTGMTLADKNYAKAIKRAAQRFAVKIVAEKQWTHTYDARRTAQSDVPVFTQVAEYDVLVVADEQGLFGEYLAYRSWIPRPVIGTQGLIATAWHRTHEQWGAVQIQNRFKEKAGRTMEEEDYAAYLAVRAIGEAAVRTHSNQLLAIKKYLLGDEFALQGYKGKPLSFRSWNGQLRQPILLAAARSLVSVAPIEGFLHPSSEMDTLGFDLSESACNNGRINSKSDLSTAENPITEGIQWQTLKQKLIDKFKQFKW